MFPYNVRSSAQVGHLTGWCRRTRLRLHVKNPNKALCWGKLSPYLVKYFICVRLSELRCRYQPQRKKTKSNHESWNHSNWFIASASPKFRDPFGLHRWLLGSEQLCPKVWTHPVRSIKAPVKCLLSEPCSNRQLTEIWHHWRASPLPWLVSLAWSVLILSPDFILFRFL